MARLLLLLVSMLLSVLCCCTLAAPSNMKMYKKIPGANKYRPILVAVSSTVIPLDELPTYTVSSRLGPATELPPPGVSKPDKPTKLITASRKKATGPVKKASVVELSKEEFAKH